MLSLAIVDDDVELGNEVTIVWGEEGGGSAKPVVERHVQAEIRAIVSPCPYGEVARTSYAEGWRSGVRLTLIDDGRRSPSMATLEERLARPGSFVVATEIVTSRGLVSANGRGGVLELARELADDPRIDVLSITDNPGGNAMFSPDALGTDMISRGQEVIIHLACKDWNRNALESRGWQLGSAGFHERARALGRLPDHGAPRPRRTRLRHRLRRAPRPPRAR